MKLKHLGLLGLAGISGNCIYFNMAAVSWHVIISEVTAWKAGEVWLDLRQGRSPERREVNPVPQPAFTACLVD